MNYKSLFLLAVLFFLNGGFGSAQNWTAQRITDVENQNLANTWIDFVKEFEVEELPIEAVASIACDSKYWMWINGKLVVFEGQLKRGPNPKDTYYDQVELAPFLQKGKNKIAILVWYFGKEGFSHKSSGQAGLVFQCKALDIISDQSWKSRLDRGFENTAAPHPNYRLPESNVRFNAQLGNFNWVNPNEELVGFNPAKVVGSAESAPWNQLVKRPVPQWKDYGLKRYPEISSLPFESKGDTLVCLLPYNAQVTPYFKISAEAGKLIDIRTDHYRGGGPENVRAEYITTNGVQEYESLGWMNGHEVRYYFPEGITVLDVKFRETGFQSGFTGSFSCSDPFFNRLWEKAVRTLYVTMRDTYMDCPDRERAQWWGDVVNESGEAFYALSPEAASLTRKGMLELVWWQKENGVLFSPVPAGNWDRELPGQMLASIGYFGFWNYYQNTGDQETIEQVYDGVKRYLDIWEIADNGILKVREGDWYWGDWGTNVDRQTLFNTWYYLALKGFRNMSELLGKFEEVTQTEQKMQQFKTAFNRVIWNGQEYRFPGYEEETDDRAQALAVVAGLVDPDKFARIYELLQSQKYASPYMEKYVIEALFQMGYAEYGLERLKERFSLMVNDPKSSTLYEGWGTGVDGFGGGSANHAWSGGGLTIMAQYVCGVFPVEPAWKTIQIKPQLGNLQFAQTANETIAGEVKVRVAQINGEFRLEAGIPGGSTGIICIPDSCQSVALNNKTIWKRKPRANSYAHFVKRENGYLYFEVQNGAWHFVGK
ncbi:alpha-L-rhamnosidase C-terminal domain-containing protein [uncultured Sunxiuqinia sp.]|uniref:alpha-L-rhamnosidase-related protein n=1 Tax=uncultured Sunxiuqinia sp. TaxID=1573825 RepID=UPI00262BD8E5|nr:alpha-L-rhamnosidase C-terminal domain-containing protein [uncultured Sunxiuqinia sp.]